MRTATAVFALVLGAGFVGGGVALSSSFARDDGLLVAGERLWLSIPQVHDRLDAAGYRNIEKIERERGGYEVRAADRNGQRVKLHVNPQTGEIYDRGGEGRRHDNSDARGMLDTWRGAADCNERRCRDDLPPKGATVVPKGAAVPSPGK